MTRTAYVGLLGTMAVSLLVYSSGQPLASGAAPAAMINRFTTSGTATITNRATSEGIVLKTKVVLKSLHFEAPNAKAAGARPQLPADRNVQSLVYDASVLVPSPGPGVARARRVTAAGSATAKGPQGLLWAQSLTVNNLGLGPKFSAKVPELATGSTVEVSAARFNSDSGCAAQAMNLLPAGQKIATQVEQLAVNGSFKIGNVDAANGLVDFSGQGQIMGPGAGRAAAESQSSTGLGLVVFGLGGTLALSLIRRERHSAAGC